MTNHSAFDTNSFKRNIKNWVQNNPQATEIELLDQCEKIIPTKQYSCCQWLVHQTLAWYKFILKQRKSISTSNEEKNII